MGILYKTKTYLVGPMQYQEGRTWRDKFIQLTEHMGIQSMDPYNKPFCNDIKEDENTRDDMLSLMSSGELAEVHNRMKTIRRFDLAMVDRADFITCYINPKTPTYGTVEELSVGVRSAKPTFIFIEGGKRCAPLWLLGMFKPSSFYDSLDEIVSDLCDINSGKTVISQEHWRLLREEYR